jgi:T5SS/PEP-CTERM-associated repeat protein
MKLSKLLPLTILTSLCLIGAFSTARAEIIHEGDVLPTIPPAWTDTTVGSIGSTSGGTLTINGGSTLQSYLGYIGENSGSNGVVTVDGTGSTWTNILDIYIAIQGTGTLSITNGGSVTNEIGLIGISPLSTGVVTVSGTGSKWINSDELDVGSQGDGTLNISNGGAVSSLVCYIGLESTGVMTVDGVGSTWINSEDFNVGFAGNGLLNITGGSTVTSGSANIGFYSGSTGAVTVAGTGSKLSCSTLSLGYDNGSIGTMNITGGGRVMTSSVLIKNDSLLAIDSQSLLELNLNNDSQVNSGGGTISNFGMVRIVAGANLAVNTYQPISAATWSGTGSYQPLGGTWDAINHIFTASSVTSGTSSISVPIDLASIQRILVNDNAPGGTNWSVGASFVAATSAQNIAFTATAIDGAVLDALINVADDKASVASGWLFSTTNYPVTSTNPVYLSLKIGPLSTPDDLQIWHYDGSTWAKYAATDLTYDGVYASFTATSFSGYAATVVPEPGTLVLLLALALGWSIRVWRKR